MWLKRPFSRDCNIPFSNCSSPTKDKDFSAKGSKSSHSRGGGNSKGLFLTNDADESPSVLTEEPWMMEEHTETASGQSILTVSDHAPTSTELTKAQEATMAQWRSEEANWLILPDSEADQTTCKELPEALIDSGATSSVAGAQ